MKSFTLFFINLGIVSCLVFLVFVAAPHWNKKNKEIEIPPSGEVSVFQEDIDNYRPLIISPTGGTWEHPEISIEEDVEYILIEVDENGNPLENDTIEDDVIDKDALITHDEFGSLLKDDIEHEKSYPDS